LDGYAQSRALWTRIGNHRFARTPTNPCNQQGFDCHGQELVQQGSTVCRVVLAKHPAHSLSNCQTNVATKVETILRQNNVYGATFYEIGQHSPIADIRKGIEVFKEHDCDVIVAVGGGSPIDASKAILYNLQKESGGPTLPQIAIPTTLSAAEYTVSS
jgi:glycerol dehydrogenase-like iron-containing ADH family enzyme